jgi:anhydro-N-acetylmuramic acid kinase
VTERYIGLMSGTSQDGLDAALVAIDEQHCELLCAKTTPFPESLANGLAGLIRDARGDLRQLGTLHSMFGEFAAGCTLALLDEAGHSAADVRGIGFSGHTVYHQPDPPHAFTMQIGNPNLIAAATGIDTVADIRGMDVACGGQGAPLLPAFHVWQFSDPREVRVVVNIGGIGNVTCLVPGRSPTGFDSGPGNTLMDGWCRRHGRGTFDVDGRWASSGTVVTELLRSLQSDAYFAKPSPKSTGLEHFNAAWLDQALAGRSDIEPADVQATLLELTATTIADAARNGAHGLGRVIICGGGARNAALINRLTALLQPAPVETSDVHGIAPEWVEAVGFAWLARARLQGLPGNLPSVTGAREPVHLGGVYSGHRRNA